MAQGEESEIGLESSRHLWQVDWMSDRLGDDGVKNETANALVCLFLIGIILSGRGEAKEGAKTESIRDSAVERRVDCPGKADPLARNLNQ